MGRRRLAALALLALLACGVRAALARPLHAASIGAGLAPDEEPAAVAAPPTDDGDLQQLVRVADGVWVLAQPRFQVQPAGNVTIVEQADGLVLVDSGGSPGAGRRVVEAVRSVSAKPVRAVLVTHWHGDHPLGLSEVLRAWPDARTIATEATQRHLRTPATMNVPASASVESEAAFQAQLGSIADYAAERAREATAAWERDGWAAAARMFERYRADMQGAVTQAPREVFAERLVLDDPQRPVEALFLGRANTDGDAVLWLPRQRILVAGDLVVLPLPFGFGSYPAEWIEVLERIVALEPAILIPGHGPVQHDLACVERLIGALDEIRAVVGPLARAGLAPDEVVRRLDLDAQAARFVGEDAWLRRWFDAYWVEPIVASACKEARGEPIPQRLVGD